MSAINYRNRSVNVHQFAMVPRSDVPRSSFKIQSAYKTTFDAGYLIPVYVDEVLPGDTVNLKMTAFTRLTTPIYPIMDNIHMETFFFFVPNRLVWEHWQAFMGERWPNPDSSIDYLIPQQVSPAGGYSVNTLQDYMGLPTQGQVNADATVSHSALFLRAYNLIWNEWFRDENLQDSATVDLGDGPDDVSNYKLLRRGKRHDYFTSALPWPQKGDSVSLPLTGNAPIKNVEAATIFVKRQDGFVAQMETVNNQMWQSGVAGGGTQAAWFDLSNNPWYADLSAVTAATINQLRQSFQIQRLLERDARGGTRYTEILRSHFGVISPDARLQRPEYLGGGHSPVNINPIAQTSGSGATGTTAPLGTLGAMGTSLVQGHGFSQSFVEHGMIIGLVNVRADLTYQQGLHKMWSRQTRYDFYFPVFAHLGEQAVLNKEIYVTGDTTQDDGVFGYQERWAEYRYRPSQITGQFRSTYGNTLDGWHLAQKFSNLPALNADFIQDNPPISRILAVGSEANGSQFYFDAFFDVVKVRPLPMYSVPGLIDHF